MARTAAEAGITETARFFSLTPREISDLLCAHGARLRQAEIRCHLLSRLTALALRDPRHLPPPPSPAPSLSPEMTDEEMKQRLLAWRGKDDEP